MPNPVFNTGHPATRLSGSGQPVQIISDTKWCSRTIAIGVAPVATDFFNAAAVADRTVDNFDAPNQLVTSGKRFMIQAISVNVTSTSIADVNAFIQQGVLVLTCQGKEIGAFRLRNLNAGGGTFVAGAQVAAASSVGVTNGVPSSDVFRISDLLIETNQTFRATLLMPAIAPYTCIAATTVEVDLQGYEIRPAA
jgi:hypothetical protein